MGIEEPSRATDPNSGDEGWVSVAPNTDNERSPSVELTGPEPSNNRNTAQNEGEMSPNRHSQWKNKGKMLARTTSDIDLDNSHHSTDRERGDPVERTPGVQNALEGASQKLCRSNRMKNSGVCYDYNEYMAHHYAYMMEVSEDREPETYAKATEDQRWIEAMRE